MAKMNQDEELHGALLWLLNGTHGLHEFRIPDAE